VRFELAKKAKCLKLRSNKHIALTLSKFQLQISKWYALRIEPSLNNKKKKKIYIFLVLVCNLTSLAYNPRSNKHNALAPDQENRMNNFKLETSKVYSVQSHH
jgi:hypothetical protein